MTDTSRRDALKCLGVGAGTLFTLSGGVFSAFDMAEARIEEVGTPLFLQISDTHIGFNKDANPDVIGTLNGTIDAINALPQQPAFALHTGDVTHLSKAGEFDTASQLLSRLRVSELHVVPGEHDVTDGPGAEFFARFGKPSSNKGYYSFDAKGVHFVALVNVMNFKPNGLGALGDDQLNWLKDDLAGRSASQPIVVFAHMPLWTIYEPWGWGTGEGEQGFVFHLAEIGAGEQFRRQDDLRAARRGLFDQRGDGGDVLDLVGRAEGELQGGDGDGGHGASVRGRATPSPLRAR